MSDLRIVPRTTSTLTKDLRKSTSTQRSRSRPLEIFSGLQFDPWLGLQPSAPSRQSPKSFSKRKATKPVSPHRHTQQTWNKVRFQMKGVTLLTTVMAVYMGSLVPKGTLTPLVPNSLTESCSGFNFYNLSSALRPYWGSTLHLQAVRPGSQPPKIPLLSWAGTHTHMHTPTFPCIPNIYFA